MAGGVSRFLDSISGIKTVVSRFLQTTPSSSSSTSQQEIRKARYDLEYLERTWQRIKAVLDDAEEREVRDRSVRLWLDDLRNLAYEAEDLLDEFQYETTAIEVQDTGLGKRKNTEDQVCICKPSLRSPLDNPSFRQYVTDCVMKIKTRFADIDEFKNQLHLKEGEGVRIDRGITEREPTGSLPVEKEIFGRDSDLPKVVDMLTSSIDIDSQIPTVVALVGMGGVGKTTLAQHAFNHHGVQNHFKRMGWVCVSDEFELVTLTRKVLEALCGELCDSSELSVLQEKVKRKSESTKFLLVMDDVWKEEMPLWEQFLSCLRYGAKGSKIMLTTRSERVADAAKATKPYFTVGCLSEEGGWAVFKQCAFGNLVQETEVYPVLLSIGREIVKKCKGLPLALKVLGCRLRYERERETWDSVLESDLWDTHALGDDGKHMLGPLLLSYLHLPAHLKPCFRMLNLFPKDYAIKTTELASLWIGNGIIAVKDRDNWMDLKKTALRYIDNLVSRSLLHDVGCISHVSVGMHDLTHDVVLYLSGDTTTKDVERRTRSVLEIWSSNSKVNFKDGDMPSLRVLHLRTFVERNDCLISSKLIRSLKLDEVRDSYLEKICRLYNLRELELNGNMSLKLPQSIANLKHLQKLVLKNFTELPESIGKLVKLQCIDTFSGCRNPVYFAAGFGKLRNVRELRSPFPVGINGQHAGIADLKDFTLLQGKLEIGGLENVSNPDDAKQACLINKNKIEELQLHWTVVDINNIWHLCQDVVQKDEQVLENLRPHSSLRVLEIIQWRGAQLPSWLREDPPYLTQLVKLKLVSCPNLSSLSWLSRMSSLEELYIMDINPASDLSMPRLEKLEDIEGRLRLSIRPEELPTDFIPFNSLSTSLTKLILTNCSFLISVPLYKLVNLVTLTVNCCKNLESIEFDDPNGSLSSSLRQVYCAHCKSLTSMSLHKQTALRRLSVVGCPSLKTISLSVDKLISLESLSVQYCADLIAIDFIHSPDSTAFATSVPSALKCLEISVCTSLTSISLYKLTSLEYLHVVLCKKLQIIDFDGPNGSSFASSISSALQKVELKFCKSLRSIAMQNQTSLRSLELIECRNLSLVSIFLHNERPALEELHIESCHKLKPIYLISPLSIGQPLEVDISASLKKFIICHSSDSEDSDAEGHSDSGGVTCAPGAAQAPPEFKENNNSLCQFEESGEFSREIFFFGAKLAGKYCVYPN